MRDPLFDFSTSLAYNNTGILNYARLISIMISQEGNDEVRKLHSIKRATNYEAASNLLMSSPRHHHQVTHHHLPP